MSIKRYLYEPHHVAGYLGADNDAWGEDGPSFREFGFYINGDGAFTVYDRPYGVKLSKERPKILLSTMWKPITRKEAMRL